MFNNLRFRFQSLMLHAFLHHCVMTFPIWQRVHLLVESLCLSIPWQAFFSWTTFVERVIHVKHKNDCILKMLFSRSTCQSVSVKHQVQLYFVKNCRSLLWNAGEIYSSKLKLSFYLRNIRSFKPGVQCSVHIFSELDLLVSEPRNVSCDIPPLDPSVRN